MIGYYFAFDAGVQLALRQSRSAIEHSRSLLEFPVYPSRGKCREKDERPRAVARSSPSLATETLPIATPLPTMV